MRVEPAQAGHILDVALRMRERDFAEFSAVSHALDRQQLAIDLAERHAPRGEAICASAERPVAIGAIVMARPNVGTLFFCATDEFPRLALALTRWIRWELFPRYRDAGVHRIECASLDGYRETHRWIEMLGLRREAVMPGYGRNGEAFVQFAWVKDAGPIGA